MKLGSILNQLDTSELSDNIFVEYRTECEGEDVLGGMCQYNFKTGELTSMDFDTYSLTDEFYKYEILKDGDLPPYLAVWYEADWISE